jgi:transcriptional regulator with XRE-family HTH domain
MARDRAGLSQEQLAARSDRPRSTIARWESGARSPSFENLEDVISASGLDLVISLAEADPSLDELIRDQLTLPPEDRLRRLLPNEEAAGLIRSLALVAELQTPTIVIGSLAAALQGGPQRPRDAVELVAGDRDALLGELERLGGQPTDDEARFNDVDRRWRWSLPEAELIVVDRLAGAGDYRDLRRDAVELRVGGHELALAGPRDLLRLADASPGADRAYAAGLRALLEQTSTIPA